MGWDLKSINAFKITEKLSQLPGGDLVRLKVLDKILAVGIPFNRWLGMQIKTLSREEVAVLLPDNILRRNHVGTAHACAQALLGEYPAGLLIAKHFNMDEYRLIISQLQMEYHKAGKGPLTGVAKMPENMPTQGDAEFWVDMETVISNANGDKVSTCKTRWQVKSWKLIQEEKTPMRDVSKS